MAGKSRRRRFGSMLVGITASAAVMNFSSLPANAAAVAGQWNAVPAVAVGADSRFLGTDALGPNDGWAVGGTNAFSFDRLGDTLIEHWDGTKWTVTPSPNPNWPNFNSTSDVLSAVTAVSPTDVWAVGDRGLGAFQGSATLIEHWNGGSWSVVPSPNHIIPSVNFYNILSDVSATSSTSAYAVGWDGDNFGEGNPLDFGDDAFPLTERWDGSQWTELPRPDLGNGAKFVKLTAVQAFGPNDALVVGVWADHVDSPIRHPFSVRWNGSSWSVIDIPDVQLSTTANRVTLQDIKGSATDAWAVGKVQYIDAQGGVRFQAVTEHWNGSTWTLVANPTSGSDTNLTGLGVFASDDAWATGTSRAAGTTDDQPLLEHWDGRAWTIETGPTSDKGYRCGLFGAAAASGGAQTVGACIAVDAATQPVVKPFSEVFSTGATPPPPPAPPAAPSNLAGRATSTTQVQLTWKDNSNNEGGFTVQRCTGSGCASFTQIAVVGSGVTSFLDTGRAPNTSYSYRVQAFNLGGVSAFSNVATVRTPRR